MAHRNVRFTVLVPCWIEPRNFINELKRYESDTIAIKCPKAQIPELPPWQSVGPTECTERLNNKIKKAQDEKGRILLVLLILLKKMIFICSIRTLSDKQENKKQKENDTKGKKGQENTKIKIIQNEVGRIY